MEKLMSYAECEQACGDYLYFGRQDNQQCFCGNSYGKHGELPAGDCDCTGTNMGSWRNCVYRTEGPPHAHRKIYPLRK